ncbi:MAG: hypothetical protein DRP26_00925 [Candidatus Zixiibacteriota bacterium]|nr:MAG: hypothetical protein DRP26_00925 [candidate division Zixibacteria bacterium]
MAKIVKKVTGYSGGIEGRLNSFGIFFLIVEIICFILCFIKSGDVTKTTLSDSWGEKGFSSTWIAIGIVNLI